MALRQRAEDHPIRYLSFIFSLPNTRTHYRRPQKVKHSPQSTTEEGLLVESPERGVLTPALTNNSWGREKEGRSAAGRNPVIAGGKELHLGRANACDRNWDRDRRGNDGKPNEQRVLLDLSDQAVVIGPLSILVQQVVKLGRHCEGDRSDP